MSAWKANRSQWLEKHPYPKDGFDTKESAQAYCDEIKKVHTDSFKPFRSVNMRWYVEQDITNV